MGASKGDEVSTMLGELLEQPGVIGYVVINFDGIPVKSHPETIPAVQHAALIADLVLKTKQTLGSLDHQKDNEKASFHYLRMRTKQDTELIVTDYIPPSSGNEYILVVIQQSVFSIVEDEGEDEEGKEQ